MKSLQRRFRKEQRNQNQSSIVSFYGAVIGGNFSKQMIQRWFNKLVSKDDYDKGNKKEIINDLHLLSNKVRRTGNVSELEDKDDQDNQDDISNGNIKNWMKVSKFRLSSEVLNETKNNTTSTI